MVLIRKSPIMLKQKKHSEYLCKHCAVWCVRALREKCPNTELFLVFIFLYSDWTVNLRIRSEYRKIRTKNNSVFGHVLRSDRETPLFLSKAFVTMNLLISFLTGSDFTRYSMEHLFFRSKILTHGRAGSCFSFSNIIF